MNIQKTPVSMLQEMMVKKGTPLSYELIHNGGGSHQNIFTYQVTCDGLSASGTGRCKKDAKHEAATAMLEAIAKRIALPQLPATPCESPVRTPLPMKLPVAPKSPANVPFRNAIGELRELCSINNLDDPQYEETGDVGPPHARIFTIKCFVSTFVEEGTATTKKQAKHEAARKMVERISDIVPDEQCAIDSENDDDKKKAHISSKLAMSRYPFLATVNSETGKSKINWGLKVVHYYQRFKACFSDEHRNGVLERVEALSNLIIECENNMNKDNVSKLKEEFESLLNLIDIEYVKHIFDNVDSESLFILGLQLNTAPDIFEIGIGKTQTEAEVNVLTKIINDMKFLLQ